MAPPSTEQSLRASQSAIKGKLTTLENFVAHQAGAKISQARFDDIMKKITDYTALIETLHQQIFPYCTASADEDAQNSTFEGIQERLWKLMDDLQVLKPDSVPIMHATSVKLPELEVPTFDGELENWTSFHDLFVASVHSNTGLGDAQKLQYLKSCLKNEASTLIKHLAVTDKNYPEAWLLLTKRYDNKREIVTSHLRRLTGQPIIKEESGPALRKMVDVTKECIQALEVLGEPVNKWDTMIVFLLVEKMDTESRRQWILSQRGTGLATFEELCEFLSTRASALSESTSLKSRSSSHTNPKPPPPQSQSNTKKDSKASSFHQSSVPKCRVCQESAHLVFRCSTFHKQSVKERLETISAKGLCKNCLTPGYRSAECSSKSSCKKCQARHHTLVHTDRHEDKSEDASTANVNHVAQFQQRSHVLLPTAIVHLEDSQGNQKPVRALLDSGSDTSFVTEDCVRRLGLKTTPTNISVKGVASANIGSAKRKVHLIISSRIYDFKSSIEALILPKVTGNLPSSPCNLSDLSYIQGLKLADPYFLKPEKVELLIGADLFSSILRPTPVIRGPQGYPDAMDTQFGWVMSGVVRSGSLTTATSLHVHCELESIVRRFWELESLTPENAFSTEEEFVEDHFVRTHSRAPDGRCVVRLPLKTPHPPLGHSRQNALRRLKQVERRFASSPELKELYVAFMHKYETLGYMKKVPDAEIDRPNVYYIPHHAVMKEASTTTKLRVVFDASFKSSTGVSLNDIQHVGPRTQDDLVVILLRWLLWVYVLGTDAKEMFQQFRLHIEDQDFQRILWRKDASDPVGDWRLTTVTPGQACSSFLATRGLKQLSQDEEVPLPIAAEVTRRDVYMDDILTGANSLSDAILLQDQLLELFRRGRIELRKWISNSPILVNRLPTELRATKDSIDFSSDDTLKTLGVRWSPGRDCFSFVQVISPDTTPITKRMLLSEIARIFDPLGWISPVTVSIKIIFQATWAENIAWDTPLPAKVQDDWNSFRTQLHHLEKIQIPRHAIVINPERIELLGFCDASEKAYGAVLYLKSMSENECKIHLLISKTRLAPMKKETLPRLELCGALLLVQLTNLVQKTLLNKIDAVHLWTDSTIVLAWIATPPSQLKTFVCNRISQIQESFPREHWHHVKGTENPADCISRGIRPIDLENHTLWWTGPSWLQNPDFNFTSPPEEFNGSLLPETKRTSHMVKTVVDSSILDRYSSLMKMKRVVPYCYRFCHRCKTKAKKTFPNYPPASEELSLSELNHALLICVRLCQRLSFPAELKACEERKPFPPKSPVLSLSPFMDDAGVLRVGGRLRHSNLTYDQKHPILLPRHGQLTWNILSEEHLRGLHAAPQLLLSMVQQRYWIVCGRDVVRHFVHKCTLCFRERAKSNQQKMADLPEARLKPGRAFLKCGVDFAGPIMARRSFAPRAPQTMKTYICLFVCFVTHAIHLELVTSLTSDAFLAALKRFVSRRGLCSDVFSDCGTNFVGATKELQCWVNEQPAAEKVKAFLRTHHITWHFNPPSSPHFGGIWEAGVRSVKKHLYRVMGNALLNYEELYTVLAQIEGCVNSRPISPLSSSPDDFLALTPGHFLIGGPLNAITEPDLLDVKLNRLSRWQLCQRILQDFWKRWQTEHLSRLQQRPKWTSQSANIEVGALVLLKDDRLPPLQWLLGRITSVFPGDDGLVRVVNVKTKEGEYKRPLVKVIPLPNLNVEIPEVKTE